MPRVKTTAPEVSREKGQRSLDLPPFLTRLLPSWRSPGFFFSAELWRKIVAQQPTAVLCRERLIENYLALDWKIEPKKSTQRDELKEDIDYYTDFFNYTGDYEYSHIIEHIGKDMLDTPFGAAAELGWQGDSRDSRRLLWLELLDAATLFPYPNKYWPIYQMVPETRMEPIFFPNHAINRVYMSPRTELKYKGWGMPPPEKIYLALEMVNRGDVYYANLLIDTPEAGILDLGDMSKEAAQEWLKAFREMLSGIDPYKIPVIYEHDKEVKYLPFNRSPHELAYDKTTLKYAALVAGGYGMSLSDLGIQVASSGGETLAGSIRQERNTRRTGFARFKKKMKAFFDRMLPDDLEYKIIDQDDELAVAMTRARLANATAAQQYIMSGIFTAEEMRLQAMADGLVTISIPEKIPAEAMPAQLPPPNGKTNERTGMLGKPVPVSGGGYGEGSLKSEIFNTLTDVEDIRLKRLIRSAMSPISREVLALYNNTDDDTMLQLYSQWHDDLLWNDPEDKDEYPELTLATLAKSKSDLSKVMTDQWWALSDPPDKVAEDFVNIFHDIYRHFKEQKALAEYERGVVDMLVTEFVPDEAEEKAFIRQTAELIEQIWADLEINIQKAVIAGTRNYYLQKGFANSLDETEKMVDNSAVEYVRQQLVALRNHLVTDFGKRLGEIIKTLLEE